MRVAIVGNFPKPFGGVATTCFYLTEQLTLSGHEVVFFDRSAHKEKIVPGGITEYFVVRKFSLTRLIFSVLLTPIQCISDKRLRILLPKITKVLLEKRPFRKNLRNSLQILLNIFKLIEIFKKDEIDVMHGHHASPETLCLMYFANYYLECPFVVTVYASEFTMAEKAMWKSDAVKVCRESDGVMCISNFTRGQMLEAGADPRNNFVVHLGVAREHFASTKPEKSDDVIYRYGLENRQNLILYVGWLTERKGPQILVESLSQLSNFDWSAFLIGPDHGIKEELEKNVSHLELSDRIKILGEIPYPDLMAFYNLASIFVFPTLSEDEGFGLVALEAMAHGLPVIASNTGAIPEVVIEDKSGLLIAPGDHAALAAHLQLLICDKELHSEMSKKAKNVAKEFTWKRTTEQVMNLYQTAIQNYDS